MESVTPKLLKEKKFICIAMGIVWIALGVCEFIEHMLRNLQLSFWHFISPILYIFVGISWILIGAFKKAE